jgi:NADPH-dependent 7-cyano-7-deazaguanine reductase QueF
MHGGDPDSTPDLDPGHGHGHDDGEDDLPALETYPTDAGATVTLSARATAVCPHDDVRDQYTVDVEYRPDGRYVEIASFRGLLDGFVSREVSHEAFTETVFRVLRDALDPAELVVEVRPQEYAAVTSTFRREL